MVGRVFGVEDDEPPPQPLKDAGVGGLKFAFYKSMVWDQAGPGTRAAIQKGMELLKAHGAEVEEITLPSDFDQLPDWHSCILHGDGQTAFRADYQVSKDKMAVFLTEHVENAWHHTRKDYLEAFDGISLLRPKWDALAEKYAAVVVPSVPDEAPQGIHTGNAVFNSWTTALHIPVVNVPGFEGENGLPVGLTLAGARYKDQALLAVANEVGKIWEKEGGWTSGL